jgi:hypothetical protein
VASYREVNPLSAVDAAYIAGIVDGEGTITLSRKHAGEGRQLVISVSNTERGILEFVRERIGAGKITTKRTSRIHHAPGLPYAAPSVRGRAVGTARKRGTARARSASGSGPS